MLDSINDAVDYIEKHLEDDIDYGEIAKISCCSQYHFQRMFTFATGIPLSEYIRRRRLTLAAFELQNSHVKIIDVALKYGYSSPDAFTRAFQNMHGVTPSKVRDKGIRLKAYPRITFTLTLKGVVEMNYRIEEKEGFAVVGIKEVVSTVNGENFKKIPQMWSSLSRETMEQMGQLSDRDPSGVIGVCANMNDDIFDYWIGAATTKPCPENFSLMEVPAYTWAIFESVGPMPDAIQEVWKRIWGEWFPTSGYEHAPAPGPEIEWYSDGDPSAQDYKSEVWIPVVKK